MRTSYFQMKWRLACMTGKTFSLSITKSSSQIGRDYAELPALAETSRQLFDIAFPEFAIRSPEHFIALLTHKRVGELRSLIDEANRGDVEFDVDFARSVFHEVIGVERTLGKRRRLLGYLTFPIGFLPFVGNYEDY